MKIAVIGVGYVGLVSAACWASMGNSVVCCDVDAAKILLLSQGQIPIFEPGLEDLVRETTAGGYLKFTTSTRDAISGADLIVVSVGTPARLSDGHADLSHVFEAVKTIGTLADDGAVVVIKSTVPVGTGDKIERIINSARGGRGELDVVSNPEFLREGSAINDFLYPDRVIVGAESGEAGRRVEAAYAQLGRPIFITTRRSSELIKYASNAFLAMKLAFVNEMADLCENSSADIEDVAYGMGLDSRIGDKFLKVGPGFGGSCFPKDSLALAKAGQDFGCNLRLIEATITANDSRKRAMARRIVAACGGTVWDKRIAVLGLTFKANTDDVRESPALTIVQALIDAGASVVGYDPEGSTEARAGVPKLALAASPYEAASGAAAVVIATEWDEFRKLDLTLIAQKAAKPLLVDLRRVVDVKEAEAAGLQYIGVGQPSSLSRAGQIHQINAVKSA